MSIEIEQFESIARASGFHDFDVMGNGCYADDFLQHFYLGWHASREGVEVEAVAYVSSDDMYWLNQGGRVPCFAAPRRENTDIPLYTHPASAVPNAEYIRALQDAFDIIQAGANTEQNYGSLCRMGRVPAKLRATPAKVDGYAHDCRLSSAMDGSCISCGLKQEKTQ